jgi:hypothetical protein
MATKLTFTRPVDAIYTNKPWEMFKKQQTGICILKALEYTGLYYVHFLVIEKKDGVITRVRNFASHSNGPCMPTYDKFITTMLDQYKDWDNVPIMEVDMQTVEGAFRTPDYLYETNDYDWYFFRDNYEDVYETDMNWEK